MKIKLLLIVAGFLFVANKKVYCQTLSVSDIDIHVTDQADVMSGISSYINGWYGLDWIHFDLDPSTPEFEVTFSQNGVDVSYQRWGSQDVLGYVSNNSCLSHEFFGQYRVFDSFGNSSNIGNIHILIDRFIPQVLLFDEFATIFANETVTFDVSTNDSLYFVATNQYEFFNSNVPIDFWTIQNENVEFAPDINFSGDATLDYHFLNECGNSDTATIHVLVNEIASLNELPSIHHISVSPNPGLKDFVVKAKLQGVNYLSILDLQGNVLKRNYYFEGEISINLNDFQSGMYIFEITNSSIFEKHKITLL